MGGVNQGPRQRDLGLGQTLAQLLFLAAVLGQCIALQAGTVTGGAGTGCSLARLLQRFRGEQPAGVQGFTTLEFAGGLFQPALRIAQLRLGLGPAGVDQLPEGSLGFAQPGLLFVVAQFDQQIARFNPVAFTHMAGPDHPGELAAHPRQGFAGDLAAGHHALHQQPLLKLIAAQQRPLPGSPEPEQQRQ